MLKLIKETSDVPSNVKMASMGLEYYEKKLDYYERNHAAYKAKVKVQESSAATFPKQISQNSILPSKSSIKTMPVEEEQTEKKKEGFASWRQ